MSKYSNPIYDKYRDIILLYKNNTDWETTKYLGGTNKKELEVNLKGLIAMRMAPTDMTAEMWLEIYEELYNVETQSQRLQEKIKESTLVARNADNDMFAPNEKRSSWQLYKKSLKDSGWSEESIAELEKTTSKILKKMNIDTSEMGEIKGLVIGNVQSGKTANMAALMAMAADWGWNMFIVLSGIIENLRKQTEDRLMKDLDLLGNLSWQRIPKPSVKSDIMDRTHRLHFEEASNKRYLTVCLKNSTRLTNLIGWLKEDAQKLQQMKILIIDDEADQAGINTKDVTEEERSKINEAIVNLVHIRGKNGEKPRSMNYISYTATPYANFLNEALPKSLYPKDFIGVLNPAKEYFGPKQIFGLDQSEEYRGLKIIRTINTHQDFDEHQQIKNVHNGKTDELPHSFQDAIYWFFCAASVMRYRKYKKPISMLVHTSQKQSHHELISKAIQAFINKQSVDEFLKKCELLYKKERVAFTLEDFNLDFEGYPIKVKDYPPFSKIQDEIIRLKSHLQHIELGDEGKLDYHDGIHLCVDNCANNGINDESMHVRLAYPDLPVDHKEYPSPAPAFIVVGGSTLSRGLTIEGLVSTYFLRTTTLADTLMQMGRWFGYRKGYEMLPRIWMTLDTQKKFKFLANLEEELRDELKTYSLQGESPEQYGPRVKNSPKVSWLRVTAKNRSQSAVETSLDFSGTSSQTTFFYNDKKIQEENLRVTLDFLNNLRNLKITRNKNGIYWDNVPFETIKNEFLLKFNFHNKASVFNQIEALCKWYEKNANEADFTGWNVVVAGSNRLASQENKHWEINGYKVGKVTRTRLNKSASEDPYNINIGVLRAPTDLYADIDQKKFELLPEDYRDFSISKVPYIREVRLKAGLGKTPQLLIYRIDAASSTKSKVDEAQNNNSRNKRFDLKAESDLIGVSLFIPGQQSGRSLASALAIRLYQDDETNYEDIEGVEK